MALLGAFAYKTSSELLQQISVRQLDALAESKKRDLLKVYDSWQDQIRQVRSRAQLQESLYEYLQTGSEEALHRLTGIVEEATTAHALGVGTAKHLRQYLESRNECECTRNLEFETCTSNIKGV